MSNQHKNKHMATDKNKTAATKAGSKPKATAKPNDLPKRKPGQQKGMPGTPRPTVTPPPPAEPGNKMAEKWTEATVVPLLEKMLCVLKKHETTQLQDEENPVRANTIKLLKETCLCVGISSRTFSEWVEKFVHENRRDYQTNEMGPNPTKNEAVSDLIQQIKDICECRLQYSGTPMDIFILKNHYNYRDQTHVDATSNGKDIPPATTAIYIPSINITKPEGVE